MKAFLENAGFHFWLKKKCCILKLMRASVERGEGRVDGCMEGRSARALSRSLRIVERIPSHSEELHSSAGAMVVFSRRHSFSYKWIQTINT